MASIWDLLQNRIKQQMRTRNTEMIQSGTVIGVNGTRITVALGSSAIDCESGVAGTIELNDVVWVARGSGAPLILGVSGKRDGSQ